MNAVIALQPEVEPTPAATVNFTLNGRKLTARKTDTLIEIADREGVAIPRLCYKEGMEAVGNCRSCMVEVKGERVLAPACCRVPLEGMEVTTDSERALKSQQLVIELLQSDMPEREYTRHNEVDEWAAKLAGRQAALRTAPRGRRGSVACRHRRQSRCLHPVHALRARLPRRADERRHRSCLPRPAGKDRVRHGRPDGGVDLRGLRRMRAGLSDRCADAGAGSRADGARQVGQFAVSLLRRRLPADLSRQG